MQAVDRERRVLVEELQDRHALLEQAALARAIFLQRRADSLVERRGALVRRAFDGTEHVAQGVFVQEGAETPVRKGEGDLAVAVLPNDAGRPRERPAPGVRG